MVSSWTPDHEANLSSKNRRKIGSQSVVQLNRVPKNVDDGDINIMNDEDDADADADVDVDMSHALKIKMKT